MKLGSCAFFLLDAVQSIEGIVLEDIREAC